MLLVSGIQWSSYKLYNRNRNNMESFQRTCVTISNYLDVKLLFQVIKERYSSLNIPNLYHYIVLDPKFYNEFVFNGLAVTLTRLSYDLASIVGSIVALVYYLSILVIKTLFLVFPHAMKLSRAVIKFHREKLSPTDIALEAVFLTLFLMYLYYRKSITRKWTLFQANLSRKSKRAAKILPHLLFFSSAGIIAYFGSKFLRPLSSNRVLPIFTVVVPLLRTGQTIRKTFLTPQDSEKEYTDSVVLWIVLSIYYALVAACESIPFSDVLLSYGLYVREFTVVTAVWVQASPTCANIVFEAVHPLILYYTDKIPAASLGTSASLDSVFVGLRFFGLSERLIRGLKGLMEDSIAVLVCFVFLFMPFRLANIGYVIIALLLPAYKSSYCVISVRDNLIQVEKKLAPKAQLSAMTPKMWLEYWTCLGFVILLRFYNLRLWPSVMMILCLWLQNANFGGSSAVLSLTINFFSALICYKRKEKRTACIDSNPSNSSACDRIEMVETDQIIAEVDSNKKKK